MDISALDTKGAAERGASLHLKHPALGHLLYSGEGADPRTGKLVDKDKPHEACCAVIRGIESTTVRKAMRAQEKAALAGGDPTEELEEKGLEYVCLLVIDFTGLTDGGKPLKATDANKRKFFAQSDDLVLQVLDFAKERANFFNSGSTS